MQWQDKCSPILEINNMPGNTYKAPSNTHGANFYLVLRGVQNYSQNWLLVVHQIEYMLIGRTSYFSTLWCNSACIA